MFQQSRAGRTKCYRDQVYYVDLSQTNVIDSGVLTTDGNTKVRIFVDALGDIAIWYVLLRAFGVCNKLVVLWLLWNTGKSEMWEIIYVNTTEWWW